MTNPEKKITATTNTTPATMPTQAKTWLSLLGKVSRSGPSGTGVPAIASIQPGPAHVAQDAVQVEATQADANLASDLIASVGECDAATP